MRAGTTTNVPRAESEKKLDVQALPDDNAVAAGVGEKKAAAEREASPTEHKNFIRQTGFRSAAL